MKKVLTIAVVAMLATSMAFAGISGYGQLGYKYDFDSKDTGFTNDTNIKVDVDVVTASAEAIAEGAVYESRVHLSYGPSMALRGAPAMIQ